MRNTETCNADIAAHVAYEIQMLRYAYDQLAQLHVDLGNIAPGEILPATGTGGSSETDCRASVLLESFLLHARVLRDFFCLEPANAHDDDVLASHFISDWNRPNYTDYRYIGDHKERLDKAMAHLTTARVRYKAAGIKWDMVTMRREIESMINRFLAEVPNHRIHWFAA